MPPLPSSLPRGHQSSIRCHEARYEVTIFLNPAILLRITNQESKPNLHGLPHSQSPLVISIRPSTQEHDLRRSTTALPTTPTKVIRHIATSPDTIATYLTTTTTPIITHLPQTTIDEASISAGSLIAIGLGSLAGLLLLTGLFSWLAARRRRRLFPSKHSQLPTIYYRGPDGEEYYKPSPYSPTLSPLDRSGLRCDPSHGDRDGHRHYRGRHKHKHRHRHHRRHRHRDKSPSLIQRSSKTGYDYAEISNVQKVYVPVVRTRVAPATRRTRTRMTRIAPMERQTTCTTEARPGDTTSLGNIYQK